VLARQPRMRQGAHCIGVFRAVVIAFSSVFDSKQFLMR
jgi:hypothetical protein